MKVFTSMLITSTLLYACSRTGSNTSAHLEPSWQDLHEQISASDINSHEFHVTCAQMIELMSKDSDLLWTRLILPSGSPGSHERIREQILLSDPMTINSLNIQLWRQLNDGGYPIESIRIVFESIGNKENSFLRMGNTLRDMAAETPCGCIRELDIIGFHANTEVLDIDPAGRGRNGDLNGTPGEGRPDHEDDRSLGYGANVVDGDNAAHFGRALAGSVCFCDPCTIVIRGCNAGRAETMMRRIAAVTGCTVIGPNALCTISWGSAVRKRVHWRQSPLDNERFLGNPGGGVTRRTDGDASNSWSGYSPDGSVYEHQADNGVDF